MSATCSFLTSARASSAALLLGALVHSSVLSAQTLAQSDASNVAQPPSTVVTPPTTATASAKDLAAQKLGAADGAQKQAVTASGTPSTAASPTPVSSAQAQPPTAPAPQNKPAEEGAFDAQLLALLNQPGGLTAAEAGRQAAARSLDAALRRQDIAAAEAEIDRTFYNNLPRLTLTAQYQRLSPQPDGSFQNADTGFGLVGTSEEAGPLDPDAPLISVPFSEFTEGFNFDVPPNQFFLNAGIVVPVSDYLLSVSASIEGAELARDAARLNEAAARLNSAANAKLAYYSWVLSELEAVVAEQSLTQAEARLGTLDRNFAAGRIAKGDVLSGKAFVASNRLLVRRARTGASLARQQLAQQMRTPAQNFTIGEDPLAPFVQAAETKNLDQLYQEAVRQRLELRALASTAYALDRGVEVTEANQWPRIEATGNVMLANPNQRIIPLEPVFRATWDLGIRVVWTPNDLKTAGARAEALKTDKRKAELQKQGLKEALRTEILSAYRSLSDATLGVETAHAGMAAAKAAYESRAHLFQFGRATNLELVDAQTALLRAKLDLLNSHISQRIARVQLDHAVGRDAKGVQ